MTWRDRAACRGLPIDLFFGAPNKMREAACGECRVKAACLDFVLASERQLGIRNGYYAGTIARERTKMHGAVGR